MAVGIVVVSHSAPLAEAAVELAMQMVHVARPPVALAAGADGGLGTDATAVAAAIAEVDRGDGVAILVDLGSALMSAELGIELYGRPDADVRILPAPFVEGLILAVIQASVGGSLDSVARAALDELAARGQDADAATVLVATDARRQEVYAARYRTAGPDEVAAACDLAGEYVAQVKDCTATETSDGAARARRTRCARGAPAPRPVPPGSPLRCCSEGRSRSGNRWCNDVPAGGTGHRRCAPGPCGHWLLRQKDQICLYGLDLCRNGAYTRFPHRMVDRAGLYLCRIRLWCHTTDSLRQNDPHGYS